MEILFFVLDILFSDVYMYCTISQQEARGTRDGRPIKSYHNILNDDCACAMRDMILLCFSWMRMLLVQWHYDALKHCIDVKTFAPYSIALARKGAGRNTI